MSQRAHGNCTYCRSRIEQCIYRYFGPCRFDAAETVTDSVEGAETAGIAEMPPDSLQPDELNGREPETAYEEILKLL